MTIQNKITNALKFVIAKDIMINTDKPFAKILLIYLNLIFLKAL